MQTLLPPGTDKRLKEIEFFETYRSILSINSLPLLQKIGKIFPPYSVATELTWTASEASKGESVAKMEINLVANRNLLNKNSSFKEDKNFFIYQEKIRKELSKFNPLIKLNWGKLNTQQNISLNMEYPLTFEGK